MRFRHPNDPVVLHHTGVVRHTDKAFSVRAPAEGMGLVWIPHSQVVDWTDYTVTIPAWLYQKKKEQHTMIKQWSYSRYSTWDKCPRRAKYQYVDKLDQGPPGEALVRGTEIHEQAEDWLKSTRKKKLPTALRFFPTMFNELRFQRAEAEKEYAFTRQWESTGWLANNCWVRIKIDAVTPRGRIIDFKTGKIREEHDQQLELYAVAGFLTMPKLKKIMSELWYLDHGRVTEQEYERADLPALIHLWMNRVDPMLNDKVFEPKPSPLCGWCPYSGKKGGPCDAG